MTVGYDRADALARAIAERITVNANEAGITMRASPDAPADAHVLRLRISSLDARTALEDLAEQLKTAVSGNSPYAVERALLGNHRVIPLVHVPVAWQLSPKVHGWSPNWRRENAWLEP